MRLRLTAFVASLGSLLAVSLGAHQSPSAKPTVLPVLAAASAPGFLVESVNTGDRPIEATTFGRCQMRIDGHVVANELRGGSGTSQTVAPGGSWRELIRLTSEESNGKRIPNPSPSEITGNVRLAVHLTPGKHFAAFNCGGNWSDEVAFAWFP